MLLLFSSLLRPYVVKALYKNSSLNRYFKNTSLSNNIVSTLSKHASYNVNFILSNGTLVAGKAKEGDNLLDVVLNNNLDIDGFGACEGTLSCSTCHVIFSQADYDKLPEKPSPEELDMLDLAYELTSTSRLGCQVTMSKDLDGLTVKLPNSVIDNR